MGGETRMARKTAWGAEGGGGRVRKEEEAEEEGTARKEDRPEEGERRRATARTREREPEDGETAVRNRVAGEARDSQTEVAMAVNTVPLMRNGARTLAAKPRAGVSSRPKPAGRETAALE